jgi:hypothetical protein
MSEFKITWSNGTQMSLEEAKDIAKGCVGPGWSKLIDELFDTLPKLGWNGELHQIKEKYAGLRFYIGSADDKVFDFIDSVESRSFKVCEECGLPGKVVGSYWIKTLCDSCNILDVQH